MVSDTQPGVTTRFAGPATGRPQLLTFVALSTVPLTTGKAGVFTFISGHRIECHDRHRYLGARTRTPRIRDFQPWRSTQVGPAGPSRKTCRTGAAGHSNLEWSSAFPIPGSPPPHRSTP